MEQPQSPTGNTLLPGSKFARLTNLPADKLDAVREMLRHGHSPLSVANKIQGWGLCLDVSAIGLGAMLARYRDEIPDLALADGVSPKTVTALVERVERNLNVLEQLAYLNKAQKRRHDLASAREETTKFAMKIGVESADSWGRTAKIEGEMQVKFGVAKKIFGVEGDSGPRFEPKSLEQALKISFIQKELVGVVSGLLEELDGTAEGIQPGPNNS